MIRLSLIVTFIISLLLSFNFLYYQYFDDNYVYAFKPSNAPTDTKETVNAPTPDFPLRSAQKDEIDPNSHLLDLQEKLSNPFSQFAQNSTSSNQPREFFSIDGFGDNPPINSSIENLQSLGSSNESLTGLWSDPQQQLPLEQLERTSPRALDGDMSRLNQLNQQFKDINEKWKSMFGNTTENNDTEKVGTQIRV